MFKKAISATLVISLFLPQITQAAIKRGMLTGSSLGIAQCQHIKGGKTKLSWRVIINDPSKPINATHFTFRTNDGVTRDVYGAVFPTADYQTSEIFEGFQKQVTVSGEAYHINLLEILRYSLRQPLTVECD